MAVRRRETRDLPGCVAALREVHLADRYPTAWPADPRAWLDPPGTTGAWVAEVGGVLAGHACLVAWADAAVVARTGVPAERLVAVKRLFSTPAARGGGVGRALLDAAVAHAAQVGRTPWLDVVDGEPAVAFYERLGWRHVERRPADRTAGHPVMHVYLAPR
ncbi:GNAT family N-acetyltransferase [Pseudonocardia sp. KRD-184]|uniref:GNAT family N-acetyltransferase n=1 Tax=Pseudonocardia oceani TaxID=2792013 RepID=A0ABS6U9H5_9PSEU|nr:GNAT family N-acetyltransferase [Pseudonocardia oceani]MBW0089357.1 GNAT family N-acetyltransferase [Pseudonocardia oceani]MBW0095934.1 GNAT family N-acetyltransferase [Pseudonocardia oceani]MBW0108653.1 GNAT family N-acetyltransferase [Pseudonocardia oceani]MBW0122781.1 GNAT family N-acetyltransferase [Pseudonocardia oceani]MBW0128623.1 GNAT family N-acetyltransferase [Pseudonocardia oceani]